MSGLEVDANSEVIEALHSPHHARVHYGMSGLEADLNSGGKVAVGSVAKQKIRGTLGQWCYSRVLSQRSRRVPRQLHNGTMVQGHETTLGESI